MNIIVNGSMAYDRIMDFPGHFAEHILPEKIHILNVSFTVNGVKEKFGGTAGNIAYALTLMGFSPVISATMGHDYHPYFESLKKMGISTQAIKIIDHDLTACAYITTDQANNQITGFHPGAMNYSSNLDLSKYAPQDTLVIISPGNVKDMVANSLLCRKRGIDYIFDPGQSLPMLSGEDLLKAITGCRLLICNDYEIALIINKTGRERDALLKLAQTIIVTRGEQGSTIYSAGAECVIPAAKPRKVTDPTGAGDSFRGGLIAGLLKGLSLQQSALMGSTCASFCLESYGTQEYHFTQQEFDSRLANLSP